MYDLPREVYGQQTEHRQHPAVQYVPPTVIDQYMNQWITTVIPGYGKVVAYVADYNQHTGMVSLLIYPAPSYQQQYIQVHYSDLVGVSPYFGPTPPHPHSNPHPGPWGPGHHHHWHPWHHHQWFPGHHHWHHGHGHQHGGFWPGMGATLGG